MRTLPPRPGQSPPAAACHLRDRCPVGLPRPGTFQPPVSHHRRNAPQRLPELLPAKRARIGKCTSRMDNAQGSRPRHPEPREFFPSSGIARHRPKAIRKGKNHETQDSRARDGRRYGRGRTAGRPGRRRCGRLELQGRGKGRLQDLHLQQDQCKDQRQDLLNSTPRLPGRAPCPRYALDLRL
jgi:hypothetical protein